MNKLTLKDHNYENETVLVRCDFNVPIDNGTITDNKRIVESIPTIKYLIEEGAKLVLMSHLGRPGGQPDSKFSLEPVAKELTKLLNQEVTFLQDDNVVSDEIVEKIKKLKSGQVVLLENTRFRKEEAQNEENFSKELASLADYFVNDAFGTSHRAHCSNVGVGSILPSALGFLVEKEVSIMGETLENPKRPFMAILGGAKVSDKIGVIENLLNKIDVLVIVGAMANTFLKSMNYQVGKSLVEDDKLDLASSLLDKAKETGVKVLLPIDVVVAEEISESPQTETIDIDTEMEIPSDKMILDIGPKTIEIISDEIKSAKTVVWNGPAGVFEVDDLAKGTFGIANALANSDAITIIGGGDSAAAIAKTGLSDNVTHVSTGGGASLELLEGKILPGIDVVGEK